MKTLTLLHKKKPEIDTIAHRHGVRILRVFGSVARGTETRRSDIDFLVKYERTPTFSDIVKAQDELTELLGRRVQFVARDELSPIMRHRVKREAVAL
jgi:predicted nucleotidyltransferase